MKLNLKIVSTVLGIIVGISSIITIVIKVDTRWAKASDLEKVEFRLEQKIQQDRVDALQERMWKLNDRYNTEEMPQEVKEEYREIKKEKVKLENYIEKVIEKTIKDNKFVYNNSCFKKNELISIIKEVGKNE